MSIHYLTDPLIPAMWRWRKLLKLGFCYYRSVFELDFIPTGNKILPGFNQPLWNAAHGSPGPGKTWKILDHIPEREVC